MQSTYGEFGNVANDPKKNFWDDAPAGEPDPKSKFVQNVFFNFSLTLTVGFLFVLFGLFNKTFGRGLESSQYFLGSLALVAALGALLYFRKDVREQGLLAYVLFYFWCLCVALCSASFLRVTGNSNFEVTMYFTIVTAACCCYLGATRTKNINDLKRNSVVGFIMTMVILFFAICFKEQQEKKTGYVGGATELTICILAAGAVCFYITFAMLEIQLKEVQDVNDVIYYSIRLYIDIVYAIFLALALLWEKIWG